MPSWNELLDEFSQQPSDEKREDWLKSRLTSSLSEIGALLDGRNVLLYGSAFLQKPQLQADAISITHEDLNGFMSCIYGMDWSSGLTLLLHTPGGDPNAAETIVSYLRSKFFNIEVIIPTFAMSAGTMISLSANRIMMGRQSQMGPIDPQMVVGGRLVSAQSVVDLFEQAKDEVLHSDPQLARVWAPILPSLGPSLLTEAQMALSHSESMVAEWLEKWMFAGHGDAEDKAAKAARYFNDAQTHKSHGRRIGRDEAKEKELMISDLEMWQDLQEQVLTAYHVMTITFESSHAGKLIRSGSGTGWVKNYS